MIDEQGWDAGEKRSSWANTWWALNTPRPHAGVVLYKDQYWVWPLVSYHAHKRSDVETLSPCLPLPDLDSAKAAVLLLFRK